MRDERARLRSTARTAATRTCGPREEPHGGGCALRGLPAGVRRPLAWDWSERRRSPRTRDGDHRRTADLEQLADGRGRELEGAPAAEILRWAAQTFGAGSRWPSSMQDAVLVHLASQVAPGVDVLFLDTGYHFAETIGTRDAVAAVYDVNAASRSPPRRPSPSRTPRTARGCTTATPTGAARCARSRRWTRRCARYDAWATGLRRDESPTRADTPVVVATTPSAGKVKIAPLAGLDATSDVDDYIAEHGVLINPLLTDGYPSIGCAPVHPPGAAGRGRPGRPLGRPDQDRMRDPP